MTTTQLLRVASLLGIIACFSSQRTAPAAAQEPPPRTAALPKFPAEKTPPPISATDAIDRIDPKTYTLGPGDELLVSIVARTPADYPAPVRPDGSVFLPAVGSVSLRGKTLAEADGIIGQAIARVRKDFRYTVQLTRLRTIKVEVQGEVPAPGVYVLGPLARAADAVSRAGGPSPIASWRHVRVHRSEETLPEVNLERIWRLGEPETNVLLETGDRIYVPRAAKMVNVSGEVNIPGDYEVDPSESVVDVIRRAGGVKSTGAETATHVERPGPDDRRVLVPADLTRDASRVVLQDRDRIVVPALASVQGRIRIVGAIKGSGPNWTGDVLPKEGVQGVNSGLYLLRRGDRVKDVIENVGGLTAKADRTKAQIERWNDAGEREKVPVNLYRLLVQNDQSQNMELRDGDTLVVPTIIDQVYVLGQVLQAGAYQYEEGRTILDYVSAARGPGPRARKGSTTLVRGDLPKPETIKVPLDKIYAGKVDPRSIVIKPGDIIVIPEAPVKTWQDVVGLVWTARALASGLFLFR